VFATDALGNFNPEFTGEVTLALTGTGGVLHGTLTVNAVAGVASFTGLNVTGVGAGYSLVATAAGLTAGTSATFDVIGRQLIVTTPAGAVTPGVAFPLKVSALNAAGKVDVTFAGPVTVSLGGSGATLGGTLTVNAVKGVATFAGLTINNPGRYFLTVSAIGAGSAATRSITVLAPPVALDPTNIITTTRPTFNWTAVPGADHYAVTIIDRTTNKTIKLPPVTGTAYTLTAGSALMNGHQYTWTVAAVTPDGETTATTGLNFSVAVP
jgi:hypothetical protein